MFWVAGSDVASSVAFSVRSTFTMAGSTAPAAWSQTAAPRTRPAAGLCALLACRQPVSRTVRVPRLALACGVAPGRYSLRAWPRTIRADPGTSYDHIWTEVPGRAPHRTTTILQRRVVLCLALGARARQPVRSALG